MEPGKLLLHPIRLRIVQALIGRSMTTGTLQETLVDVPQASLYRHVNRLVTGGILEVVEERPVRGGVERTFGVVQGAAHLDPDDVRGMTADDHQRAFGVFVGTLLSDFGRYLDAGEPQLGVDRVGYRQTPMWLSDDELDSLLAEMRALVERAHMTPPGPGRRRRLLSTVLMPDPRRPPMTPTVG